MARTFKSLTQYTTLMSSQNRIITIKTTEAELEVKKEEKLSSIQFILNTGDIPICRSSPSTPKT